MDGHHDAFAMHQVFFFFMLWCASQATHIWLQAKKNLVVLNAAWRHDVSVRFL